MLVLSPELQRTRLISDEYLRQQEELHKNPDYGMASVAAASAVSKVCNTYGVDELLDYGAGKGRLAKHLQVDHPMRLQMYDPAIPKWSETPDPTEMVACIDVLEHIEPHLLENVLDDLKRVTKRIGFFTISTVPAGKTLSDGRNAHLIQCPPEWWLPKILERWDLHVFQRTMDGFFVLVMAREMNGS
jgi:2-polyprenyl-3-methyl-5-hydroxy-6-metoxy-1,4-benzoquinol methylase